MSRCTPIVPRSLLVLAAALGGREAQAGYVLVETAYEVLDVDGADVLRRAQHPAPDHFDADGGVMRRLTEVPGCRPSWMTLVRGTRDVVGRCTGATYLWEDGVPTALAVLPSLSYAVPLDANRSGTIVGRGGLLTGGGSVAWAWTADRGMEALPVVTTVDPTAEAHAITAGGLVVGVASGPDGSPWDARAALWSHVPGVGWSDAVSLGALGSGSGAESAAYAVNDQGIAVGASDADDGLTHAAGFFGGSVVDLGILPTSYHCAAQAITDDPSPRIGGVCSDQTGGTFRARGFLWEGGAMVDLEDALVPGQTFLNGSPANVYGAFGFLDDGAIYAVGNAGTGRYADTFLLLVDEEAPLAIREVTAPVAGGAVDATLSGATPGALVFLLAGSPSGSTRVPGCRGTDLPLRNPIIVASGTADAFGVVRMSFTVPPGLSGANGHFAAAEPAGCQVTARVEGVVE